ncbi:hypothetical protein TURU_059989 [Turdus rufiventris]|nr:hypothetical protein TURU_059989 [Turdus rufiventris]
MSAAAVANSDYQKTGSDVLVCEREVALPGWLVLAGDQLEAAGPQQQGKSPCPLVHYLNSSIAIKNEKEETGNKQCNV